MNSVKIKRATAIPVPSIIVSDTRLSTADNPTAMQNTVNAHWYGPAFFFFSAFFVCDCFKKFPPQKVKDKNFANAAAAKKVNLTA